jgi:hypothetical protein
LIVYKIRYKADSASRRVLFWTWPTDPTPASCILRQVTNGLAVRMAVLFLCQQAASGAAQQ